MKEIMMPVQVLNDDCATCQFIEISSQMANQLWADDRVVNQDIVIRCSNLGMCERLVKEAEKATATIENKYWAECRGCGCHFRIFMMAAEKAVYCPNCGREIEYDQE